MKKLVLLASLGAVLFFVGFVLIVVAFLGRDDNRFVVYICSSLVCMGTGVVMLIVTRRLKQKLVTIPQPEEQAQSVVTQESHETLFEKQNRLVNEWEETTTTRDKLKILQVAGAAEEKAQ